eukprot:49760-Eustigmatos_ZCMA.PRE.1
MYRAEPCSAAVDSDSRTGGCQLVYRGDFRHASGRAGRVLRAEVPAHQKEQQRPDAHFSGRC